MKVVFIGRYGEGDIVPGPERVARELFSELSDMNTDIRFIEYFFGGSSKSSFYKKLFGKEISKINNNVAVLGIMPLMLSLLKEKFDIIHLINSQRFTLIVLIMKIFFRSRLVTTFHGFIKNEIPAGKFWSKRYFVDLAVERLSAVLSDLRVFPSELLLKLFNENYNIAGRKNIIIPNGISKSFESQSISFPPVTGSLSMVFYNGYSSSPDKGLKYLVDVLSDSTVKISLFVIGEKTETASSGNVRIVWSGYKNHNELTAFLMDKQFLIKGPVFDTFPVMVAECMSMGIIPVISTNTGIKDFIEHGFNGFIYPDQESLLKIINDIGESKFDLQSVSRNAAGIKEQLNWQKICSEYLNAYKSVL